jgi:hypothetical protein
MIHKSEDNHGNKLVVKLKFQGSISDSQYLNGNLEMRSSGGLGELVVRTSSWAYTLNYSRNTDFREIIIRLVQIRARNMQ